MSSSYLASLLEFTPWEYSFDQRTRERAQRYAEQRRVAQIDTSLNANGESILVHASVRGSGNQYYQCRLTLGLDDGDLSVDSSCSCPVGYLCKHAAATLYTAMNSASRDAPDVPPDPTRPPTWSRWLEHISRPEFVEAIAEPERRLGILLADTHADDHTAPHLLMAQIAWMRPSRTQSGKRPDRAGSTRNRSTKTPH